MAKNIFYVGNFARVVEYIYFNDDFNLIGVICESDKINDDILSFCLVRNVKLYKVDKQNKIENYVNSFDKDAIYLSCSYGKRIPIELCLNDRIFNIHYALLPHYKGRHPTFYACVNNEKYLGISLHKMTSEFDSGDIIAQKKFAYYLWENENDIFEKLTKEVPNLLKILNDFLENRDVKLIKNSGGSYFKPVSHRDTTLDLSKDTPATLFNKTRSQVRANGAKVYFKDRAFALFDLKFSLKTIKNEYEINKNLFIKYKDDICIVSSNFKEIL